MKIIAQPEPIPRTVAGSKPLLTEWIVSSSEEHAAERLGIYSHMYFSRLHDSLKEDFLRLFNILGRAEFERFAAEYVVAYPPSGPSLRRLGAQVPEFLSASAWGELRPDLPDLCRLDLARIHAFDAENGPVLDRDELAGMPPNQWAELVFSLVPSFRLLTTEFAVERLWVAADRKEALTEVNGVRETILVWRRDFVVRHRTAESLETRALECVRDGATFGAVCEMILAESESPEDAVQKARRMLEQWVTDGLFARADSRFYGKR